MVNPTSAWTPVAGAPPAPAPAPAGNSIQASQYSILDRLRGAVANSAVGHSLEAVLPKIADALNLHPTETVNSPTYQSDRQNLVAPQYLFPGNPQTQQGQKAKALLTGVGNLTNPKLVATGAAIGAGASLAAPLAPVAIPAALAIGGIGAGGAGAALDAIHAQGAYNQGNVDAGNASTAKIPQDLLMLLGGGAQRLPGESNVPGENYTPTQLKAHTGILGRMNGLGDNFIPQDNSASTLSTIRQAAADNPAIAATALKAGSTPENIAAFQAILQKANTALETPHASTIAQNANVPADVSGVQAAVGKSFPRTLTGVSPEDAAAIQQLQQRLGTVNTLGGLNDLRGWLNDEAAAGYKQDGVAASRGTATKAGIRAAADAARNAYFDQLQKASGIDFKPVKQQQSALLDQQEGAAKLGQSLSSQQAVADEPKNAQQVISEALTGGRALKAGPIAGASQLIAEKVLGRTPLTQPNYLIRKALSSLPDASIPASIAGTVPPSQGAAPVGLPSPPAPGTGIQPVYRAGTATTIPTSSTNLAGPELSAPARQGQLPQGNLARFLTESASPDNVQTSYPQLNPATARTVVQPSAANPKPGQLGRRIIIGPDGLELEPYPLQSPFQRIQQQADAATLARLAKAKGKTNGK